MADAPLLENTEGNVEITTNEFKSFYVSCKEEGKTDKEIAKVLNMTHSDLSALKKFLKVPTIKCRPNAVGLTEEHFRIAASNGISRRVALKRRRESGWSIQDSITLPSQQGSRYAKLKKLMK